MRKCVSLYIYDEYGIGMRSVTSREIMKVLKNHGWLEVTVRGSHHQFTHPTISGRVTVPHPKKDLPWPTVKSILKQAGLTQTDLQ